MPDMHESSSSKDSDPGILQIKGNFVGGHLSYQPNNRRSLTTQIQFEFRTIRLNHGQNSAATSGSASGRER